MFAKMQIKNVVLLWLQHYMCSHCYMCSTNIPCSTSSQLFCDNWWEGTTKWCESWWDKCLHYKDWNESTGELQNSCTTLSSQNIGSPKGKEVGEPIFWPERVLRLLWLALWLKRVRDVRGGISTESAPAHVTVEFYIYFTFCYRICSVKFTGMDFSLAIQFCFDYRWVFDTKMTDVFLDLPWNRAPNDWQEYLNTISVEGNWSK